jgi:single-stranded-DNA-specific exonuclease
VILLEKKWEDTFEFSKEHLRLPLSERVLIARGYSDEKDRQTFLAGGSEVWHDPFLLPDMKKSCDRIYRAIADRERILVFGDYDADGVTATALLVMFLRKAGADCEYMIPDRLSEGYGMSEGLFMRIQSYEPSLMITVDCGISDVEEIDHLTRLNIDIIVTDHHEVKPVLPSAFAIVNAKRNDSIYPFPLLSGVGIALKLVEALSSVLFPITDKDEWKDYLDLAMLGTIADVVLLTDENRTIVKQGIEMMSSDCRVGIRALIEVSAQDDRQLSSTSISYLIVPRINASGRMGDATRAVELLMTTNEAEAREIASLLTEENVKRQEIELRIFNEAVESIEQAEDSLHTLASNGPIVVLGEDWHPGVIGIVASRLVSRYYRPAIVFTKDSGQKGLLKGSARSVEGFNILASIIYAREFTSQFGGHPKAAGISVHEDSFSCFVDKLSEYVKLKPESLSEASSCKPDARISSSDISIESSKELKRLEPFGEGNPEPCFLLEHLVIEQTTSVGHGRHLKFKLQLCEDGQNRTLDGIAFGYGQFEELYQTGDVVDILCSLSLSVWKDRETLSLMIRDIRFSRSGSIIWDSPDIIESLYRSNLGIKQLSILSKMKPDELIPQKEDFKCVYQFLRTHCTPGFQICDVRLLSRYIQACYKIPIHGFALMRILDVFEEAGLLRIDFRKGQRVGFMLLFIDGKVKLENTDTYQRIYSRRE